MRDVTVSSFATISTAFHRQQLFENLSSISFSTTCPHSALGHPDAFSLVLTVGQIHCGLIDKREEKKMSIKSKILWLSVSLALMSSMIAPAVADEWNKETKLEFSGP